MSYDRPNSDSDDGSDSTIAWLGSPPSADEIEAELTAAEENDREPFDGDLAKAEAAGEILEAEVAELSEQNARLSAEVDRKEAQIAAREPFIDVIRDAAKATLSAATGVSESHYEEFDAEELIETAERLGVMESAVDRTAALAAKRDPPDPHSADPCECGAVSANQNQADTHADRATAALGSESSDGDDELAQAALTLDDVEGLNIDEHSETPPSWYVSEVYHVDLDEFDHGDDLRATVAEKRGSDDVRRRRSRVHRQLRERRADRVRAEVNAKVADGEDAESLLASDSLSRSYESPDDLARASLGGQDTATLSELDAGPAEYVKRVYGLSPADFGGEQALAEAITEADDEHAEDERRALLSEHRERQNAELRADLAAQLEPEDDENSDDDPPAPAT